MKTISPPDSRFTSKNYDYSKQMKNKGTSKILAICSFFLHKVRFFQLENMNFPPALSYIPYQTKINPVPLTLVTSLFHLLVLI